MSETPNAPEPLASKIGGWILGGYFAAVAVAVSLSPWLKQQPWWPWKRNRKA
jgi:hypothetical protein